MTIIPEVSIGSNGQTMPIIGMGTASNPPVDPEATKRAILDAIKTGYRHFDTALVYGTEAALGEAIAEALTTGLVKSREELFITSKLWCSFMDRRLVLPAIKTSLGNLKLEYLDLYLIHWPLKLSQSVDRVPFPKEEISAADMESVWEGMEECLALGLTKSIGVCNFSSKRLDQLLSFAKIPPAVNQVELNPFWQQKELRNFCKTKSILLTAYSPLAAPAKPTVESDVLGEIAKAKGKTIAQVSLKWIYEQGVSLIPKSFNKERMKENLDIFGWSFTEEELNKISLLPQRKTCFLKSFMEPHHQVLEIDAEI
ncbi:D-galacturonate reductase [Tripterygium wilfordii]|uniref:D-galacturonate reductase n=1 Tax=Tripterygium wilfordii TaxID=458696 RepID=A0A7J7CUI4_TRIWF|nr:D-galacturonate reductase-like [Tripterygium wilfordii]KAF5737785.1 D-galacturonate reductase [Tripterygium wilfordii]